MPRAGRPGRPRRAGVTASLGLSVSLLLLFTLMAPAQGSSYPPLPVRLDRDLLGNLSAPALTAGASGEVTFTVGNPLGATIAGVTVTLNVYAFNAFPGNATSTVPVAGAPVLSVPGSSGAWANVSVGALAPGEVVPGSVAVATSASTPDGTFAVRTAVSFDLASNGTPYRLESRGWFSSAEWEAATELPNGSVTLNLTTLGVSGVTPETAVYVQSSGWDWVLAVLLAAAAALLGAAAWVYFRRGPGSTSGTR